MEKCGQFVKQTVQQESTDKSIAEIISLITLNM